MRTRRAPPCAVSFHFINEATKMEELCRYWRTNAGIHCICLDVCVWVRVCLYVWILVGRPFLLLLLLLLRRLNRNECSLPTWRRCGALLLLLHSCYLLLLLAHCCRRLARMVAWVYGCMSVCINGYLWYCCCCCCCNCIYCMLLLLLLLLLFAFNSICEKGPIKKPQQLTKWVNLA